MNPEQQDAVTAALEALREEISFHTTHADENQTETTAALVLAALITADLGVPSQRPAEAVRLANMLRSELARAQ